MATSAANKQVTPPIIVINCKTDGLYSNINEHLATKNTPAVTIVAAWIKAETELVLPSHLKPHMHSYLRRFSHTTQKIALNKSYQAQ